VTAVVVPRLRKEVRGLLPMWLICLVPIAFTAVIGRGLEPIGFAFYVFGAVAIGALSIGQEYNCSTLTLLLSQPINRGRLLLHKAAVLAVLLAVLAVAVWWNLAPVAGVIDNPSSAPQWRPVMLLVPLLSGFFLAPWLTMVCGSPLAGMVFAFAIPGAMWVAGDLTAAVIYGGELSQTAGARALSQDIFWRGTVLASLAAAVGGWWSFTRLEAIDRRGFDVRLPAWFSGRARETDSSTGVSHLTRRRAVWLLVAKELRLQQLTFAISGLYIISWIALLLLTPVALKTRATALYVSSLLHAGAIPLLAGSLASAEERQLGVLGWQTLLPIAAWKPWTVKASVALLLTVGLVFGLPALMSRLPDSTELIAGELSSPIAWSYVFALVAIAVSSLYVGSLCTNGLRALVISMPVALAVVQFAILGYRGAYGTFAQRLQYLWSQPGPSNRALVYELVAHSVWVVGAFAILGLLLRFGLVNYRSAERGSRRVVEQVAIVAALVMTVIMTAVGASAFSRAEYRRLDQLAGRVHVSGVVLDARQRPVTKYTVAIFGDGGADLFSRRFARGAWVRPVPVLKDKERTDSNLLERLKARAMPVEFPPNQHTRVTLTLTDF
jgi:hypothetical protein